MMGNKNKYSHYAAFTVNLGDTKLGVILANKSMTVQ